MTTNIAIVGYGNIGRGVHRAIDRNAELYGDVALSGIISRRPLDVAQELMNNGHPNGAVPVINANSYEGRTLANYDEAEDIDIAILCGGSKKDLPEQGPNFVQYFNTVDSFDTHAKLPEYFAKMDEVARDSGTVSVISTGWDPGTFSLERVLGDAFIPGVKPYGFYGLGEKGGLSMGHSDAIRKIKVVRDARQYTHALPEAIERVRRGENPNLFPGDMHWRECVVVAEEEADEKRIENEIKDMPNYFEPYKTTVEFVSQEELDEKHSEMFHDGLVIARGETGDGNMAMIEYKNQWASNPEATANILIAHARAAHRLSQEGRVGAFTILDIPAAYLSPRSREELLENFM